MEGLTVLEHAGSLGQRSDDLACLVHRPEALRPGIAVMRGDLQAVIGCLALYPGHRSMFP